MDESELAMERRQTKVVGSKPTFPLMKLPAETRLDVYHRAAQSKHSRIYLHDPNESDEFQPDAKLTGSEEFHGFITLFQANRTIYHEASRFYMVTGHSTLEPSTSSMVS